MLVQVSSCWHVFASLSLLHSLPASLCSVLPCCTCSLIPCCPFCTSNAGLFSQALWGVQVDATPDLEGPGHEAASPESPTGHLPVEQTCGGWPAKQLAAATQLGPGMPAEEQDEACNQDLVLGTLIQDDAQLGEDTEDPLSVQPGQPHDGNTAMAPNTAGISQASLEQHGICLANLGEQIPVMPGRDLCVMA